MHASANAAIARDHAGTAAAGAGFAADDGYPSRGLVVKRPSFTLVTAPVSLVSHFAIALCILCASHSM